jgi:hypothetical protein
MYSSSGEEELRSARTGASIDRYSLSRILFVVNAVSSKSLLS